MSGAELTQTEFAKFRELIYKMCGIQIGDSKSLMMSNRLRRRLRATRITGFSEYLAYLSSPSGKDEVPLFLNEITTNETYFYRDAHHFEWLAESYFPEVLKAGRLGKRPKRLRIWSAASSTGEELYSIVLKFMPFKNQFNGWTLDFVGTDLSKAALAAAARGVYDSRAVRNVSAVERTRYFDHDQAKQTWTVKEELRNLVRWNSHNLIHRIHNDPFDCIFIKNVLIYFDNASKLVVTKHLIRSLDEGGHLIVGPTEGIYAMLTTLEKRSPWLYVRP